MVVDNGLLITIGQSTQPFVLTDKIIVQIAEHEKPELIENIAAEFDANVLGGNPFNLRQFVISLRPDDRRNALEVSNAINKDPRVRYALPNFYAPIEKRQASVIPNDTFFGNQWHLDNIGQGGGTADADIDADLAWSFGLGDSDIIIAIIDDGFEMDHPDLMNGGVVNGYDFTGCTGSLPCGGSQVRPFGMFNNHGTAAAGVALGRSNNSVGVSGVCPQCTFMPIRAAGPIYAFGLAIDHAHTMGADVISLSWGSPIGAPAVNNVVDAVNNAAASGRDGLGSIVLFAMTNQIGDNCAGSTPDISSLTNAIAVSRSTNQDRFSPGGFGACMDVLAPTSGGTLHGVTTDRQDTNGFNNLYPFSGCPSPEPAPPPDSNLDYTFCFQGTSFATPLVAGVAGLILSQDNTLMRQQVQQLLQDTADKISDSSGAYSDTTGFSPTHGYGRVNAFEAVRTVGSTANDGRGGVDVYLRDNRLDWGNTEQLSNVTFEATRGFIPHWQSVDIKIDAPPLLSNAPATSSEFDAFVHENPLSGTLNRVYVRVHNRGHRPATDVTVKLQWAFAGAGLPALPADFWTAFPSDPADVSIWHPLPVTTIASVPYSGTSLAGGLIDGSTVVTFDFNAPAFDASLPNPDHYCLFAVIDAPDDGVSTVVTSSHVPDFITPRDNNVTHRNVHLLDSGQSNILEDRLIVSNPFQHPIETRLVAQPPGKWRITIAGSESGKAFELGAYKSVPVNVSILPGDDKPATIDVVQLYRGPSMEKEEPLGGITYDVAVRKPISGPGIVELVGRHQLLVEKYQETVLEVISKRALSSEEKAMLDQLGTLLEEQGRLLRRVDGGGRQ
jgi:subtilisin family serine protease